jgi:hypothetical protein
MITVGYLKKRLAKINDDALVYAYDGEITGIIIFQVKKHAKYGNDRKYLAEIHASEDPKIEDKQDEK